MTCPCGSARTYDECCGPFIAGAAKPTTAEALMRSRYTAFTLGGFAYIGATFAPKSDAEAHAKGAEDWASSGKFKKLRVLNTEKGGADDSEGVVEFVATYTQNGKGWDHHEVSHFVKDDDGGWVYIGGNGHRHPEGEGHHHHDHHHEHHRHQAGRIVEAIRRETPKVGRNEPCPCGSGKKFKKCHGV